MMPRTKDPQSGRQSRIPLSQRMGGKRGKFKAVLTGSVASGKTTALEAFERLGWRTLSADAIVADIYEREGISKDELRRLAQDSPRKLRALEKWVHPLVRKEIERWMRKHKGRLVVEIPLVFETKMQEMFDLSFYVFAPQSERKKRAKLRGMKPKLFDFLESRQLAPEKKARQADFVLHNRNKASLQKQIEALGQAIEGPDQG